MKNIIALILILITSISFSQDLVTELNGFKLNQFRDVPTSEFKIPLQKKTFDDGFELELFLIKPDSSAYMVFEYANWDKEIIWSAQIYGDDENLKPDFKNLKMGMSREEVIERIGKPTNIESVGEYGEILEYDNTNYSFEINNKNRLSSIKIKELFNNYYPKPNVGKIPSFKMIVNTLQNSDNKKVAEILSPGIEIYKEDKVFFFKNSWRNEIEKDLSKIYDLIQKSVVGLEKTNTADLNEYEENMRVNLGQNTKHVLKFKKHPKIEEIVLKWEFGKYLIWEMKLK
jgi:hypothetical protein